MSDKKIHSKVPRRSFLLYFRNLTLLSTLQAFSSKVSAISAPHMRKARRALGGPVSTLWTWGDSTNGKLGNTGTTHRSSPVQLGSLTDWSAIASGDQHGVAIKAGTLWSFGRNNAGQLGDGSSTVRSSPVQVGSGTDWQKVAAGGSFSLASKTNNSLWAFGNNGSGRLGIGNITNMSSPVQIGTLTDWDNFEAGGEFGAAIKANGTLWTWGINDVGQLGDGTNVNRSSPVQIGSGTNWKKVVVGYDHAVAVKLDGTLWTWGSNELCQQGFVISSPQLVNSVNTWTMLSTRKQSTVVGDSQTAGGCAIRSDGTLWCWGTNIDGQVGTGLSQATVESPQQVGSGTDWAFVNVGPWSAAAVKTTGTLWTWGYNSSGELGLGDRTSRSSPVQVGALSDWAKVSIGESFMLAVKTNFTLWSWGGGTTGVLGSGTSTAKRSSPVQVGSLSDWSQVASGPKSSNAIKTDGTLWTWGAGTTNQLGNGSSGTVSSPIQIGTDTTWTMVSRGSSYGMGIKAGTLWGWGANVDSQLGLGAQSGPKSTPIQVGAETTWTYISCAYSDSLGIKIDGSLWNWGTSTNEYNFSGTSSPGQKNSPVRIGALTTWSKVELGEQGVMAVQTDGRLWAWGRPFRGAFGTVVISPKQLGSLTTWTDVAAANYHTVAIQTDGTLWNWGSNSDGQMGSGFAYEADALPIKVGTATTWTKISAGGYTTVALQANGSAWSWGYDNRGQLGDGGTTTKSSPMQIGSSTNWSAISAGDYHVMSIRT
jgi:alpha-tubulin suppressor-like RCC1 family protein